MSTELVFVAQNQQDRSPENFRNIIDSKNMEESDMIRCKAKILVFEKEGNRFGAFFYMLNPEMGFYKSLDVVQIDYGNKYFFICAIVGVSETVRKVVMPVFVSPLEKFFSRRT